MPVTFLQTRKATEIYLNRASRAIALFRKRSTSVSLTRRAQWAAIKAAAQESNDARLIEVVRDAEERARETIADSYGRAALMFPTDKQLDELCGVALDLIQASSGYRVHPEVRHALAAVGFVATKAGPATR